MNLRNEEYAEDSRVPEIRIGTPEEDAFRRDLTINAMFYNINEGKVEDFTNRGISDMQQRVARTPLEPFKTFMDDPLRILRVIRFAQRFNLECVQEIEVAAQQDQIVEAFGSKLSNERILKEMDKMFEGKNAHKAIQQMYQYRIFPVCLKAPVQCEGLQDPNVI